MRIAFDTLKNTINFEKTYYYTLLLFAFVLPLSRAADNFFVIFLMLLLLLQGEYKKHFTQLKNAKLAKAMLAFMAFMALSLLWTEDFNVGLDPKMLYLEWFAVFAIALNVKSRQIPTIISAFVLGMLISILLSYGMFFELWEIRGNGKAYPSPFMFHIDYSVFLAFTAMILLNRFFTKQYDKKEKSIILLLFLFTFVILFLNIGRTGQVGFLAGLVALVFLHYRFKIKSILLLILLIGTLWGAAYQLSDKFQERVNLLQQDIERMKKGQFYTSGGLRVAMIIVGKEIITKDPLIGVGVGDFDLAAQKSLQKNDHNFIPEVVEYIGTHHFHNQYLNILIQGGLIALGLFLFVFFQYGKLPIADLELKRLSILFMVVFMTSFLTEPLLFKQFTNTLFTLFTGLFLGASLQNKAADQTAETIY